MTDMGIWCGSADHHRTNEDNGASLQVDTSISNKEAEAYKQRWLGGVTEAVAQSHCLEGRVTWFYALLLPP